MTVELKSVRCDAVFPAPQSALVWHVDRSNPDGLENDVPLRFESVRLKLQIHFPSFSIWLSMIGSNSSAFLMR